MKTIKLLGIAVLLASSARYAHVSAQQSPDLTAEQKWNQDVANSEFQPPEILVDETHMPDSIRDACALAHLRHEHLSEYEERLCQGKVKIYKHRDNLSIANRILPNLVRNDEYVLTLTRDTPNNGPIAHQDQDQNKQMAGATPAKNGDWKVRVTEQLQAFPQLLGHLAGLAMGTETEIGATFTTYVRDANATKDDGSSPQGGKCYAVVTSLRKEGPAFRAGLRWGDAIVHVGDRNVEAESLGAREVIHLIEAAENPVNLTVARNGVPDFTIAVEKQNITSRQSAQARQTILLQILDINTRYNLILQYIEKSSYTEADYEIDCKELEEELTKVTSDLDAFIMKQERDPNTPEKSSN